MDAAVHDTETATLTFDGAQAWLRAALAGPMEPLAAEVWVLDPALERIVLIKHRWRAWVPPGGKVEPGETPREGAARELAEETGLRLQLLEQPAAVAVRSFHPKWPATLSLSYAAIADPAQPLVAEDGQPVAWTPLQQDWQSFFPGDASRIRQYVEALRRRGTSGRTWRS
ncbi:NUDIX domain-containing protein [Kitasatospora sp. NPDC001175]|uniref:NUDIX domain-containing protein n=1 Tax=Kitasatospora sp. NPDC001175 TaxID=3157103 RepID=UPI003D01E43D